MKKLGRLQKLGIFAVASIVIVVGISFLLRSLIASQLLSIRMLREEAASSVSAIDVAVEINDTLRGRENLLEDIENLLPNLIEIPTVARGIESEIAPLFSERPEVQTGGVSRPEGSSGDVVQAVQLTIRGRIQEQNFDKVLDRLAHMPILMEIESATLDLNAVAAPNQGQLVLVGKIFAKDL